jgi:MinD-like ATPase involved in chromosome partitioning or flagellar assembly
MEHPEGANDPGPGVDPPDLEVVPLQRPAPPPPAGQPGTDQRRPSAPGQARRGLAWFGRGQEAAEERARRLRASICRPVEGRRHVVVLSASGGVGKTTVAAALGHCFAAHRSDRVIAIDASPYGGTLVDRVVDRRHTGAAVRHVVAAAESLQTYEALRQYLEEASTRLHVLASDTHPASSEMVGPEDLDRLLRLVDPHFTLVIWDGASGLAGSTQRRLLELADQVVIVTTMAADRARAAQKLLSRLVNLDHLELTRRAVLVVNRTGGLPPMPQAELEERFGGRCGVIAQLPFDPVLEAGGAFGVEALQPATREAWLQLAATVAGQWPASRTVRHRPHGGIQS